SMRLRLMRAHLMLLQETRHEDHSEEIRQLDSACSLIFEASEPSVPAMVTFELLRDLRTLRVFDETGSLLTPLTEDETQKLMVSKGTLSEWERLEVENHVNKTYDILKMIPWSRGLEQVPELAYKHHEKLDGSGYPEAIAADQIPPQTRIMTICDIYDALIATDRPYRLGMTTEPALHILPTNLKHVNLVRPYFTL